MLYDELMTLTAAERARLHMLMGALPLASVYEVSDVARFAAHMQEQTALDYQRELPNVAPLGHVVWMEFDARTLLMGPGPLAHDPSRTCGVLLVSYDRQGEPEQVEQILDLFRYAASEEVRWVTMLAIAWLFAQDRVMDFTAWSPTPPPPGS